MQKVVYDAMRLDFSSMYGLVASPSSCLISPSGKFTSATVHVNSKSPQMQISLAVKPSIFTIEHIFVVQSLQSQFSLEFQRKSTLIVRLFGRSTSLRHGVSTSANANDCEMDAKELSDLEMEWSDASSLSHICAYNGKKTMQNIRVYEDLIPVCMLH